MSRSVKNIEGLLLGHTPGVREIVQALRLLVLETVPQALESVNMGWHSLGYRHPQCGYFCGVFPGQDRVKLIFEFGVLLPDPLNLLQGDGKQVRFVEIMGKEDIETEPLEKLLQSAIDLPKKREIKLAMIRAGARPSKGAGEV